MKRILIWFIVAIVLVIGLVLYQSRSRPDLNVDPHTRDEIEKAMHR